LRRVVCSPDEAEDMAAVVPTAVVADRTVAAVADSMAVVVDFTAAAVGSVGAMLAGSMAVARLEAEAWAERGASVDLQTEARHLAALVDSGPVVQDPAPWAARTRALARA
jgi:hypothetical protein